MTVYLVIKRKESFLFLKPLEPKKLKYIIVKLGTSFVKLAQVLATRSDFFGKDYLDELKNLHDQIPPMNQKDFEEVYKVNVFAVAQLMVFSDHSDKTVTVFKWRQHISGYVFFTKGTNRDV